MAVNTRILFTDLDGTLLNDNKRNFRRKQSGSGGSTRSGTQDRSINRKSSGERTPDRGARRTYRRGMLCHRV